MTDVETLTERVQAVERTVADESGPVPDAAAITTLEGRVDDVEDRLDEIDDRLQELDAATQAVRGYVGSVRSVNENVEQRADAALAATERLERRLDERDGAPDGQAQPAEPTSERPQRRSRTVDDRERTAGDSAVDDSDEPPSADQARRPFDEITDRPTTESSADQDDPGVLAWVRALL